MEKLKVEREGLNQRCYLANRVGRKTDMFYESVWMWSIHHHSIHVASSSLVTHMIILTSPNIILFSHEASGYRFLLPRFVPLSFSLSLFQHGEPVTVAGERDSERYQTLMGEAKEAQEVGAVH